MKMTFQIIKNYQTSEAFQWPLLST